MGSSLHRLIEMYTSIYTEAQGRTDVTLYMMCHWYDCGGQSHTQSVNCSFTHYSQFTQGDQSWKCPLGYNFYIVTFQMPAKRENHCCRWTLNTLPH